MYLILGVIWLGLAAILAFWTQNNLEFWVSYSKGVPTSVPYWKAWVASIPIPLAFMADLISSVVRLWF